MPIKLLAIKPWGPPKLQEIVETLQDGINERTPLASESIDLEQKKDGVRIVLKDTEGPADDIEGGSGDGVSNGTPTDLVGASDGQPVTFHLFQSSAATPL